jgi:hypothetical protein
LGATLRGEDDESVAAGPGGFGFPAKRAIWRDWNKDDPMNDEPLTPSESLGAPPPVRSDAEPAPRAHPMRDSVEDSQAAAQLPSTPQTRAPSYRLAFADDDFLLREELRPVRLQLELLKPQLMLDEAGVETTIVLFGGARIPDAANAPKATTPMLAQLSRFYEEARRVWFSRKACHLA